MVIYGEYLFFENFITGLMILILTSKLCGTEVKKSRYFVGAVLCGLFSFIIFAELAWIIAILSKLVFSAVLVILVFHIIKPKPLIKIALVFYSVSFAMGGITIGIMYFIGAKGVANNSFIYLNHITYLNIAVGVTLTYLLISRLAAFIKDRIINTNIKAEVSIFFFEQEIQIKGLVDTGNFLAEPISGYPVMVLSYRAAMEFMPQKLMDIWLNFQRDSSVTEYLSEKIRIIPYQTVGKENGMLLGFKPDKLILREVGNERILQNVYIAIGAKDFDCNRGEQYAILLHRDILDKGIGCYD